MNPFMGAGLGTMFGQATQGMVGANLLNMQLQRQQKTDARQEEELKLHKMKAYIDVSAKALDMTPDDKLDVWLKNYNEGAPKFYAPLLTGVRRTKPGQDDLFDADGKMWTRDKQTGQVKPALDPATGRQLEKTNDLVPVTVKSGGVDIPKVFNKHKGTYAPATTPEGTAIIPEKSPTQQAADAAANVKMDVIGGKDVVPEAQRAAGIHVPEKKPEKPEITPAKAFERISQIHKTKIDVAKNDKWTDIMTALMPQAADKIGQPISDEDRQALYKALDEEENYLRQYTNPKQAAPSSGQASAAAPTPSASTKQADPASKLNGKAAGRYRVDGVIYRWDGTKAQAE